MEISIKYYERVYSSLIYLAGRVHLFCAALYYHVWSVWLYHILPHKWHDFQKSVWDTKWVFWFSLHLLSKTFLILWKCYKCTQALT